MEDQRSEEVSLLTVDGIGPLSAASPQVAAQKPMADLVLAVLQAAGRSEHTRRLYQTAIGLFLQFLDNLRGDRLPAPLQGEWRPFACASRAGKRTIWEYRCPAAVLRLVDASLLDAFRSWREGAGDSINTATVRMFAVRSFLRVAYRDHILTMDQALSMGLKVYQQRQRKDEIPVGRRLSRGEVQALRSAVDTGTLKGKRDLAILDVMLYAGLRREEVAGLCLADLRLDGSRLWLVLVGKGGKTRRIKVHEVLYHSLSAWLAGTGKKIGDQGTIFAAVNKADRVGPNPINASVVGRLVAEYGYLAGLAPAVGSNRLSPHDLRRTCARNTYDNGASLLLVQAMLGHSDPKTTARYIGAYDQDDQTAVDYVRY